MLSPTKIKELCKEYGLSPSKKYGQNYLVNFEPIKKMLESAELSREDTVVEIGPGFGILTFALAEKVKKVIAYEIEKKLIDYWAEKLNNYKNIEIVWGNFLNQATSYPSTKSASWRIGTGHSKLQAISYKVVANLPYQITSHILRILLEMENKPEKIVVMVQKEVAERICARPGDMSMLAVSVQYYGEPKIISRVSRGNFWPEPKVDSAILSIKTLKHENIKTFSDKEFFEVVKAGFANKRKQLWRNLSVGLKIDGEKVKKAVKEATGNEKIRAEELSVEQWKELVDGVAS